MEKIPSSFSYNQILMNEFEKRNSINHRYSLRSFARDIRMSPSRLSEILNQKRGLSPQKAQEILKYLPISEENKKLFLLAVEAKHHRSPKRKSEALNEINSFMQKNKETKKINETQFGHISGWYYYALLELIETKNFKNDCEWIAQKLHLNKTIVESALDKLETLNLIKKKNDSYENNYDVTTTSFDESSTSLKKYHSQILRKAEKELFKQDVQDREFLGMTMAFDKQDIKKAKKLIRKFQEDFANEFGVSVEKNSVYQLNVQFFRLDA